MADLKNDRRFANLNRLSTEQLEELLRTAPLLPDSQETSDFSKLQTMGISPKPLLWPG